MSTNDSEADNAAGVEATTPSNKNAEQGTRNNETRNNSNTKCRYGS
jgi:hypothetical protein